MLSPSVEVMPGRKTSKASDAASTCDGRGSDQQDSEAGDTPGRMRVARRGGNLADLGAHVDDDRYSKDKKTVIAAIKAKDTGRSMAAKLAHLVREGLG